MKYLKDFISSVPVDEFLSFYKDHSNKQTEEHFGMNTHIINGYLAANDIQPHTKAENTAFTNIEKYGCVNVFQSESAKEKSRCTKRNKYGDEFYNNPGKIKSTCLEKYGTQSASGNKERQEKIKATFIGHYGIDNIFKDVEYINEKRVEKYGSIEEFDRVRNDAFKKSFVDKYGVENPSQIPGTRESAIKKMAQTNLERYGVEYLVLRPDICSNKGANGDNSAPNRKFEKLLSENGIGFTREFVIGKRRFDFKVSNSLVEIDPTITHNSTFNPYGCAPASQDYHLSKSLLAEEAGYHCIHVFDWDDQDKIINLLKDRPTVYARKCEIRKIDKQEEADFLNAHHLQGYSKSIVALGLFYNDSLVSVMTFCKPRYNRNYQWELLRYCSSYNVIGGAEKLFSHFIKEHSPESIVSYCDVAKFKGDVYSKLGFTLKRKNKPSIHWFNIKTGQHITDNFLRQRGFDQLFGTNYGKGTSNKELMIEAGFVEVYDAGQNTYTWTGFNNSTL